MKAPRFSEGVTLALAAGITSSIGMTVLPGPFGLEWSARALLACLGLGYVLYLLYRSRERTGRVVTLALWLSLAALCWILVEDLLTYLMIHLALIWLVRVLYHQPGPLAALLDLALNLAALMAGLWAYRHADSVFLGAWSFFLVQALFTTIPAATRRHRVSRHADEPRQADHFQPAYRDAEAALRKLSAHQ